MKAMSINEMREIEGGVWVVPYAKAVALARLAYEHRKVGTAIPATTAGA